MTDDRPVIDDDQYLKAIELAIGMEFFWDSWYWPTGMQDRIKEFKAYHQTVDPSTSTTLGLCHIYLMMRIQEIKNPGSTVVSET